MKFMIFLFLFSATVYYASAYTPLRTPPPTPPAPPAPPGKHQFRILKSDFDLDPAGSYRYGFETENAIARDEVGEVKVVKNEEGKPEPVVVVRGSFSYQDHDGQQYVVTYVADENGFQPQGAHLPTL